MSINLRDYQKECLETVFNEYQAGINRQLCALPTGSGKTIIMSAIAKQLNKKTIILAHREELISQAVDKFKLFWPGVNIGVCMAERDEIDCQIVVGSVQSCSRPKRIERLQEQGFDLMMIDEAHHSPADSYQTVINSLGFSDNANKLLIGVTATPHRSDSLGLGDTFQKIVFSRSIGTMIKAGYLSPVIGRKILTNFSFERIRTRNGDFALEDLSEAINTPERNKFIVEKFQEYANDRKAIAFCCDVQHCKDLADAFREAGFNAEAVFGEMPTHDRKLIIESLKNGKIQIVTSCGILTEGFDEPSINVIVMARPTKSPGLYTQMCGRGLRLWPGKQDCLVLDFTDRNNSLDSAITLNRTIPEALYIEEKEFENEDKETEETDRTAKINVIQSIDREFDILGSARFIWIPIGDNEFSLLDDEKREIVMRPKENGYVAALYLPDGSLRQIVSAPLPLEYCSGVCEDYARRHLKITFADLSAPWMRNQSPPSQGQREFLQKQNSWNDRMNKTEASLEIRKIVALKNKQRRALNSEPITQKQKFALINYGIDPKNMTKFQAMQAIAKIKSERVKYG